jgi:hypothetical protein
MKIHTFGLYTVSIIASVVMLGGCSKSGGSDSNANKESDKPSLSAALSADGQKSAVTASLPKAKADTPLDQYVSLSSGNQLMFMYYGLSNTPVDHEKIAQSYSQEYRSTNDAFKQKDILNALTPRIDSEIAKAKDLRYFRTADEASLGSYDFSAKAFHINNSIGDGTYGYFNDNTNYKYSFTNGQSFSMLKVADEAKARQIESLIGKYPKMKIEFYSYTQDIDPNSLTVKCQIVKIRLLDATGNELFVQAAD